MPAPPAIATESARLAALQKYEVLDTPPETAFDDIAELAAKFCGTPTALVTLVDAKRQWFKARFGFSLSETARELAFCAHTIAQREVMEVQDALEDPRFATNPLVTGEPRIRFYAGVPLVTPEGHAVGSLAVVDYLPRKLREDQSGLRCAPSRTRSSPSCRLARASRRSGAPVIARSRGASAG